MLMDLAVGLTTLRSRGRRYFFSVSDAGKKPSIEWAGSLIAA
jgi:hypothetical protein